MARGDHGYDGWAVAAAILWIEDEPKHYVKLTKLVMASGISGLGSKGGKSPSQTLRSEMGGLPDMFELWGGGVYALRDKALASTTAKIRIAICNLMQPTVDQYCTLLKHIVRDGNTRPGAREEARRHLDLVKLEELEQQLRRFGRLHAG